MPQQALQVAARCPDALERVRIYAMLLRGGRLDKIQRLEARSRGVQMALKENPHAANAMQIAVNMRQAAKGYLEQFLKTDADKVEITAQGLAIR